VPELLLKLNREDREQLQSALSFPEDSVGALMDFEFVVIREDVTLDVVLRYLRFRGELPADSNQLMVTDREGPCAHAAGGSPAGARRRGARLGRHEPRPRLLPHQRPGRGPRRAFERYDLIVAPW